VIIKHDVYISIAATGIDTAQCYVYTAWSWFDLMMLTISRLLSKISSIYLCLLVETYSV